MVERIMPKKEQLLANKRIGIFGKGGSGKSTVTVLLARALKLANYNVCIIDADSTNVGLHRALGLRESPVPLIDYYGGMVFGGGAVTCPVDDPTLLPGAELRLESLPAEFYGRNPDGITLFVAGKMGGRGPGAGCDGPIAKITRDARIQDRDRPVVTLIDFKAGFEDCARGVVVNLDRAVVVVDPTVAAIELALDMIHLVRELRRGCTPATSHLESPEMVALAQRLFREAKLAGATVVLNKIDSDITENYLRQCLRKRGCEPAAVLRQDPLVSSAWLRGAPIYSPIADQEMQRLVDQLEQLEKASGPERIKEVHHESLA
jgi:CO dehydrogenase nickel-insertion accessory protein CooC1